MIDQTNWELLTSPSTFQDVDLNFCLTQEGPEHRTCDARLDATGCICTNAERENAHEMLNGKCFSEKKSQHSLLSWIQQHLLRGLEKPGKGEAWDCLGLGGVGVVGEMFEQGYVKYILHLTREICGLKPLHRITECWVGSDLQSHLVQPPSPPQWAETSSIMSTR